MDHFGSSTRENRESIETETAAATTKIENHFAQNEAATTNDQKGKHATGLQNSVCVVAQLRCWLHTLSIVSVTRDVFIIIIIIAPKQQLSNLSYP
jgi:hypothetical protein